MTRGMKKGQRKDWMSFQRGCNILSVSEAKLRKLIRDGHIRWKRASNTHGDWRVWADDVYLLVFGSEPGPEWKPDEGFAVPISQKPFLVRLNLAWRILFRRWKS
jgi:hypothetical protein